VTTPALTPGRAALAPALWAVVLAVPGGLVEPTARGHGPLTRLEKAIADARFAWRGPAGNR